MQSTKHSVAIQHDVINILRTFHSLHALQNSPAEEHSQRAIIFLEKALLRCDISKSDFR